MKKIIGYLVLMTIIIILLPLMIVKSCNRVIEDIVPAEKVSLKVNVYIKSENEVREMFLEQYLEGVVAAEMPAEFEIEALKAQAVAARTYVYGRMNKTYAPQNDTHNGADICTDSAHCQAWIDREEIQNKWGFFKKQEYWGKIERAVKETEGIIIMHEGKVVNPVFHANSGGKTENSEDVWNGVEVPYLKSVKSEGEEVCPGYKVVTAFSNEEVVSILEKEYTGIKINKEKLFEDIKVLDYTVGGRVNTLEIGNVTMKGTDFRKLLSLRSANFSMEEGKNGELVVTTLGYGHGVGMSQWGANNLAKNGGSYEEIIKYYYKGVSLSAIEQSQK